MIYDDVTLPEYISLYACAGSLVRGVSIGTNQGRHESRNATRVDSMREYEFGLTARPLRQWNEIRSIFEVTEGGVFGFRIRDPEDFESDADGERWGYLGTGFGLGVPGSFQVNKLYRYGSRQYFRPIRKIRPGTFSLDGRTAGAGAGQYVIDNDTGVVTIQPDSTQAIATLTAGASTVLNFSTGTGIVAATVTGDRVYVTGVTGSMAALINGKSHLVTAKGATSLTVSLNTTGTTGASGIAYNYAQPSDALRATFQFDIAVRFADPKLDWKFIRAERGDKSALIEGPSVNLVEVLE